MWILLKHWSGMWVDRYLQRKHDKFVYISVFAYTYTRDQFPTSKVMDEALRILSECGIPNRMLVYHNQTDCPMCWERKNSEKLEQSLFYWIKQNWRQTKVGQYWNWQSYRSFTRTFRPWSSGWPFLSPISSVLLWFLECERTSRNFFLPSFNPRFFPPKSENSKTLCSELKHSGWSLLGKT